MNTDATIQVSQEEFENQKRAMALLETWLGSDISAIIQHDDILFEYRGRLDKKQDGVFIVRTPGVAIQVVAQPPGAMTRYTMHATEDSIAVAPRPGQEGYRITLMRVAYF